MRAVQKGLWLPLPVGGFRMGLAICPGWPQNYLSFLWGYRSVQLSLGLVALFPNPSVALLACHLHFGIDGHLSIRAIFTRLCLTDICILLAFQIADMSPSEMPIMNFSHIKTSQRQVLTPNPSTSLSCSHIPSHRKWRVIIQHSIISLDTYNTMLAKR